MVAEDRALIVGLKRGDMQCFQKIFEKYRRVLFAYVRGILHDDALAEDCVQDVFLELARKADSIDIKRGVKGWLFRVGRNRAIDRIRKRSREIQSESLVHAEESGQRPDDGLIAEEASQDLMRPIESLNEAEQDIVMMRFFGGLTFAEAEVATGIPLNTLIWRCRRALEKLRKKIGKLEL